MTAPDHGQHDLYAIRAIAARHQLRRDSAVNGGASFDPVNAEAPADAVSRRHRPRVGPVPFRHDQPAVETAWHTLAADEALRLLGSTEHGVDAATAEERLLRVGRNTVGATRNDPWWRILLRQFASLIIGMLLVAIVVTAISGHWIDAVAILIAVLVDVTLGFVQELRASRAIAALRDLEARWCHVRRAGTVLRIPSESVVPGDILVVESGERVSADVRWITTNGLRVDESLLTGESVPEGKDVSATAESTPLAERRGMGWSATLVISGRAEGVVVATGTGTMVGQIDALVRATDTPTPLQRVVHRFETRVGIAVGIVAVVVLLASYLLGASLIDSFLTAVSLAVAAIPEGLPAVLTIALSLGVARMARRRTLVRTLPAVEALGSTTMIATDKTGTLTLNRMTVERVWSALDELPRTGATRPAGAAAVLRAGALSNDAHHDPATGMLLGDPVDVAIAASALEAQAISAREFAAEPPTHRPYEPARGCSATVHVEDGRRMLLVKGSIDLVLGGAQPAQEGRRALERGRVLAVHDQMAESGMRVIAVGTRALQPGEDAEEAVADPKGLTLIGLIGMSDPPRPDARQAIADCRRAGIAVVMLTGDHPATAAAIGARLDIGGPHPPVTGPELEQLDDDTLVARVRAARIAARVTPQDKLRIVRALEAAGEVVAVTGDGVNDAPALRAASIGVAMGHTGTDVAREAADIVLLDDAFATIVAAVKEGRITFAAAQKATFFLVSTGIAALLAVTGNLALGGVLIFLPAQMIWFNLVSNGIQDVGLAFERGEGDELSRSPRRPGAGLLSRTLWVRAATTAAWMAAAVLTSFHLTLAAGASLPEARTMALTVFAFLNFFQTFNARSVRASVFSGSLWSNRPLLLGAVGSVLVHVIAVQSVFGGAVLGFAPLSLTQWLLAAVVGSSILLLVEVEKAILRALRSHRDADRPGRTLGPAAGVPPRGESQHERD